MFLVLFPYQQSEFLHDRLRLAVYHRPAKTWRFQLLGTLDNRPLPEVIQLDFDLNSRKCRFSGLDQTKPSASSTKASCALCIQISLGTLEACVIPSSLQGHGFIKKAFRQDLRPACCVFGEDLGQARLFLCILAILLCMQRRFGRLCRLRSLRFRLFG